MKHRYFIISIGLCILYWMMDSGIHWYVYKEEFAFIPQEPNEIWMRGVISILIISFGYYADFQIKKLLHKEEEKRRIFKATVYSTQHILNNLLNQLMLFKLEMEENDAFSDELKALFNEALESSAQQVQQLSEVDKLTEEDIKASVYPKAADQTTSIETDT